MKNIWLTFLTALAVLFLVVSGTALYAAYEEESALLTDLIRDTKEYTAGVESVASAESCAALINAYGDKLERLKPGMLKLKANYPQLQTNPPEELRVLVEELGVAMGEMAAASVKLMSYAQDPEVMKATQRIQALMSGGAADTPPAGQGVKKVKFMVGGNSAKAEEAGFYAESMAASWGDPAQYEMIEEEQEGEDVFLVLEVDDLGTNTLSYYGSGSTQYIVNLRLKLVDKVSGAVLAGPETEKAEFTALNQEEVLREVLEGLFAKLKTLQE